jgi:hypothetical protein
MEARRVAFVREQRLLLLFTPSTVFPVPGYKTLPQDVAGPAAEQVRSAEVLQRAGNFVEATHLLEVTLEESTRCGAVPPGWLCGRLAALYRALKRYDDEVRLLECYREAQTSEDARTRFDARLSKARAIAERKRRTDTYALASVRRVLRGDAAPRSANVETLDGARVTGWRESSPRRPESTHP